MLERAAQMLFVIGLLVAGGIAVTCIGGSSIGEYRGSASNARFCLVVSFGGSGRGG